MLNITCFITFLHLVSYLMENFGLIEENAIEQESANFKGKTDVWWFINVFYLLHNSIFLLLSLILSVKNGKQ